MGGKLFIQSLRVVVVVCLLGLFLSPADAWSQKWFKKAEKKCAKAKKIGLKRCNKLFAKAFAIDLSDEDEKFKAMKEAYDCSPKVNDDFDKCSGWTNIVQKRFKKIKNPKNEKVLKKYEKALDKCARVHLKELNKGCKKQKKPEKIEKCFKDSSKKLVDCQDKATLSALDKIKE